MANRLHLSHSHITEIYQMLYCFGMRADSSGFFFLSYAIYLSAKQSNRLLLPSKWIIPAVAQHYCTTSYMVLAGINSVVRKTFSCTDAPSATYLISILTKIYLSNKAA